MTKRENVGLFVTRPVSGVLKQSLLRANQVHKGRNLVKYGGETPAGNTGPEEGCRGNNQTHKGSTIQNT